MSRVYDFASTLNANDFFQISVEKFSKNKLHLKVHYLGFFPQIVVNYLPNLKVVVFVVAVVQKIFS